MYFTPGICNFRKIVVPVILFCCLNLESYGQSGVDNYDYRLVYGNKYQEALQFIASNAWMIDTIAKRDLDPAFLLALVFPELIRYSVLKEQIEVMALSTLYIQYGSGYSDFSVGYFQMKPSFAGQLESDLLAYRIAGGQKYFPCTADNPVTRLQRVRRLNSLHGQLEYLLNFYNVMDLKYKDLSWDLEEDKLRFYATAYNVGYYGGKEKITRNLGANYFHTEVFSGDEKYCYADIAVFFFRQMKTIK